MKPLKLLQFAWVAEVALLILVGVVLVFWDPERVKHYVSIMPLLSALVALQGGAAFGGSPLKKRLENTRAGIDA